jgi:hypothetical protein
MRWLKVTEFFTLLCIIVFIGACLYATEQRWKEANKSRHEQLMDYDRKYMKMRERTRYGKE